MKNIQEIFEGIFNELSKDTLEYIIPDISLDSKIYGCAGIISTWESVERDFKREMVQYNVDKLNLEIYNRLGGIKIPDDKSISNASAFIDACSNFIKRPPKRKSQITDKGIDHIINVHKILSKVVELNNFFKCIDKVARPEFWFSDLINNSQIYLFSFYFDPKIDDSNKQIIIDKQLIKPLKGYDIVVEEKSGNQGTYYIISVKL